MVVEKEGDDKVVVKMPLEAALQIRAYLARQTWRELSDMEAGLDVLPKGFWTVETFLSQLEDLK